MRRSLVAIALVVAASCSDGILDRYSTPIS